MRLAWKIGAAVLGVLLIAAAVILIWFPGLFTCLHMKWKYQNLGRTAGQYAVLPVPEDFQEYELRGLRVSVPADYTLGENSDGALCGKDGKTRIFVTPRDLGALADTDPFEPYGFSEAQLRHYFETIGQPYRAPSGNALLYYCKDTLSVWDGLHLRGDDRRVFAELCEVKDGGWDTEETEKTEIPGGTAYISSGMLGENSVTVTMFSESGSGDLFVFVRGEQDPRIIRQIIGSFAFAESGG